MSPDASERLTVAEAAERLGVSQDAVRKRIKRGSIRYDREEDGRVYVYLDTSKTMQDTSPDASSDRLIKAQEAEIEFLRRELDNRTEELRRRDVIISQLTSRIPELEAPTETPSEPREPPTAATPQPGRVEPQAQVEGAQESAERPWWRRVFGG